MIHSCRNRYGLVLCCSLGTKETPLQAYTVRALPLISDGASGAVPLPSLGCFVHSASSPSLQVAMLVQPLAQEALVVVRLY